LHGLRGEGFRVVVVGLGRASVIEVLRVIKILNFE